MQTLADRCVATTITTGVGALTLGNAPSAAYINLAEAVTQGQAATDDEIGYVILEGALDAPTAWEIGVGTIGGAGGSLTRGARLSFDGSVYSTSPLSLGPGTKYVVFTPDSISLAQEPFSFAGTADGTPNALTLTPRPSVVALRDGMVFRFQAGATNTGPATMAVSGLGPHPLQFGGAGIPAGVIISGLYYQVVYAANTFQLDRISGALLPTGSFTDLAFSGLMSSDVIVNSLRQMARFRNNSQGGSASTRISMGNFADADDFRITLNGTGNGSGPGLRGTEIRANGGSLWLRGANTELRLDADGIVRSPPVFSQTTGTPANVAVDSAGQLRRSSSARKYKRDIADYTRGLAELKALRPVSYRPADQSDDRVFAGFVAEEVHDAGLTEFVHYIGGEPDALHYPIMVALAVAAIKELSGTVEALETARAEQETRLAALEARVTALETP